VHNTLPIDRAHLDGLVVFLTVAELRGFRGAARHLGITSSAVSQTIRALEERVGAPLLFRTTRSVSLTEAGERLLSHTRPAIEMLSSGIAEAANLGSVVSGKLRIASPRGMLPLLANRLFPDFFRAYPKVQLELHGEEGLLDIVEQGFDAGIRRSGQVPMDMVGIRITPPVRFVVVGTPFFFRKAGRPVRPEDLGKLACIQARMHPTSPTSWPFMTEGQHVEVAVEGPLISNDVEMIIRATLRGVGLARIPSALVLDYLARGEMETVLDEFGFDEEGLMLFYPSRTQSLPKLKAFAEFAVPRLRQDFSATDYLPTSFRDGFPQ
jgi:DNA-binding transcriptional LysR family regulator